jgi:FkbM family methyltransferase
MNEARSFGAFAPSGFVRWATDTTRSWPDGWLTRRCVILIRRLVASRLRGQPVDVEALGARMRLYPYNNVCEKRMLFTPQSFDPEELGFIAARIEAKRPEGFVFIDVGANIGAYSLFVAAKAGPGARILAIEPQPAIFDRLVGNIGLNAFATVKALDCAVADRAGEVTLFIDSRNSGESSVKIVASGAATPIRVPAKTLLALVREEGIGRIDAMKLDVEGAEDIVLGPFLREAPNSLRPGLLIVENAVGRWQIDLPGLLAASGYREIARTRLNLVFERDPTASDPST